MSKPKKIVISQALTESWQLVPGFKRPVFYLSLLLTAVWSVSAFLQLALFFWQGNSPLIYFLLKIPGFIVIWYLMATLITLGVRRAIGLPVEVSLAFSDCMRVKEKLFGLWLVALSVGLIYLGFIYLAKSFLASLPIVFWLFAIIAFCVYFLCTLVIYLFALPLIVTKRCSVKKALFTAYNAMKRYWLPVIILFVIVTVIMLISMIPLGIGLIWTLPMYAALYGIIFRDVCNLKMKSKIA